MEHAPNETELQAAGQTAIGSVVATREIDLNQATISSRMGMVRNFGSPHEVIAGWRSGARVYLDSQVALPAELLEPLVAHLSQRQIGTHVIISTVSETDCLRGLDGVVRQGVEALTHSLSSLLPLEPQEQCLVIALPEGCPTVRTFSIGHRHSGECVCVESTKALLSSEPAVLESCIEHLKHAHSNAYMQRKAEQELEVLAAQWKECASQLHARFDRCSQRHQEMLSALQTGGVSASEMERIEQGLRELQLLKVVAQDAAAAQEQASLEHHRKLDGKRLAAALRSARLSRPLGARAMERSRRSDGPRKRFQAEELKQAFFAVEADLIERLSDFGRSGSALAQAAADTGREVSRFEGALQEGDRPRELRSLIEREVAAEHGRIRQAREIGKADPRLGLRSLEQTQARLSLLRQIVDISEWLDSDDSAEYAIQAAEMKALQDSGRRDGAELRSLEQEFARVLDSTTPEEVRRGLIAFASVYRLQG